jgi:hypothetical protein
MGMRSTMNASGNTVLMILGAGVALGVLSGCGTAMIQLTATPSGSEPLIEYRRSGGIAGVNDHLVIYPDRRATLDQRGRQAEFSVDEAAFARVRKELDAAKLSEIPEDAIAKNSGADLFSYSVTYQGRTIRTQDLSIPESLAPVIETLNGIVRANAKRQ